MRQSTEKQICRDSEGVGSGQPTAELFRKNVISEQAFCRWKAKCGELEVSEAQLLRQLEEENRKFKQLLVQRALERSASMRCYQKVVGLRGDENRQAIPGHRRSARNNMLVGNLKFCEPWCAIDSCRHNSVQRLSGCIFGCASWPNSGAARDTLFVISFCTPQREPQNCTDIEFTSLFSSVQPNAFAVHRQYAFEHLRSSFASCEEYGSRKCDLFQGPYLVRARPEPLVAAQSHDQFRQE